MDIKKFDGILGENRVEFLKKAVSCESAEELLTLAREIGVDLDEACAVEFFEVMRKKNGLLTDDELSAVAAGGFFNWNPIIPSTCPQCGADVEGFPSYDRSNVVGMCCSCNYLGYVNPK